MKRATEQEIKERVAHIAALAMELQNGEGVETDAKLPVAFFYMSGHVGTISVRLHENGWHTAGADQDDGETFNATVYLDRAYGAPDKLKSLDAIICEMERLCERKAKILAGLERAPLTKEEKIAAAREHNAKLKEGIGKLIELIEEAGRPDPLGKHEPLDDDQDAPQEAGYPTWEAGGGESVETPEYDETLEPRMAAAKTLMDALGDDEEEAE